jgi:uncharacterized protein
MKHEPGWQGREFYPSPQPLTSLLAVSWTVGVKSPLSGQVCLAPPVAEPTSDMPIHTTLGYLTFAGIIDSFLGPIKQHVELNMGWMLALGCLLAGALIGAVLYKILASDELRVRQLEAQLQQLGEDFERYKRDVHGHFSDSALLLGKLTESYREVYQHMAAGARQLCPDHIASQLTELKSTENLIDAQGNPDNENPQLSPPLDYVRPSTDSSGTRPSHN